jgi:hypothetical protein
LRGGQSAWRATRGAKSRLGWGFEGSRARWGAVARWGCSSRACRGLVLDLACAGACRTVIRAVADLLRELAVWTRRAELLGAAASSRSCGSGSRSCGSGCGSRSRGSGSGSGGEMSRPGPAALLALKGRMANSAGDNSVPGTIAAAEAVCSASLLSQRPTHSACRPGRARPRGPSGRLQLWSVKTQTETSPI